MADVHGAIAEHLARRRERVSFAVSPDAVHPDATGHWLMAQTLLLAWEAPGIVAEAAVDAAGPAVHGGAVRALERSGDGLRFTWSSPLPYPMDPACDPKSIALERVADRLNRDRLAVTGLPAGRYRLAAGLVGAGEEAVVGTVEGARLAAGLDLTALPDFPTVRLAQEVRTALEQRNQAVYGRWRQQIAGPAPPEPPDARALEVLRRRCRPRDVLVRIEPVG